MRMMKTNKIYIAAATLALGLAACSEQADFTQADVVNAAVENGDMPVQFDTYMGSARNNTRAYLGSYTGGPITNKAYDDATDDGLTSLKKVGFGVFAYYSGEKTFGGGGDNWSTWALRVTGGSPVNPISVNKQPNFMYNEKLTWNDTKKNWDYQNVKYWPNGKDLANVAGTPSNTATEKEVQYLNFFAYAPYVALKDGGTAETAAANLPAAPLQVTSAMPTDETYGITYISTNTEAKDMQVKYAFKPNADDKGASEANAVDLLWGLRGQNTYQETDNVNNTESTLGNVYNINLTKQVTGEKVKFLFKHALSRVGGSTKSTSAASGSQICGLKAVVDIDKNSSADGEGQSAQPTYFTTDFDNEITLVTIEEVKIRDKYTYDQEQAVQEGWTSDFATDGWFDIMQGEWTKAGTNLGTGDAAHGITYSISAKNDEPKDDYDGVYALNPKILEPTTLASNSNLNASTGKWTYGDDYGVDVVAKNVFDDETVPGLLLIPGVEGGSTAENTLYVTVKYWVRTVDTKLAWDDGGSRSGNKFTEVQQEITNKVVLNESILDPNKFYTLVMHLGLTSVKFEAVVADWSGTEDGTYTESGSENPDGDKTEKSVWLPSNVVADVINETAPATGSKSVTLTGLKEGATLTVVSVDGTVVKEISDVSATTVSSGSSTVTITLQSNTGTTKRSTGKVVLTDGEKNVTINLTQDAGALTATLNTAFSSLTAAEFTTATEILSALTNAASTDVLSSATYSTDAGWVTISGSQITNIAANDGAERKATITVKVDDATTTVEITQPAP